MDSDASAGDCRSNHAEDVDIEKPPWIPREAVLRTVSANLHNMDRLSL